MTPSLEGRVVLVTGGGSGMGRATALEVVARGGRVAVLDRDAAGVDETLARAGNAALGIPTDVADETAVAAAVGATVARFGRLDGVVTAAGIFLPPDLAPLAEVSLETFTTVLGVNLTGTFLVVKHALTHLVRDDGAPRTSVVTVASTAALRGHGFGSGYTASKGGVVALTRLAALQYGPRGVRVNCICPGAVATPMAAGAWDSDEARARMREEIPLGVVAEAVDVATVAAFLLSADAHHVTGQILTVDGGSTLR